VVTDFLASRPSPHRRDDKMTPVPMRVDTDAGHRLAVGGPRPSRPRHFDLLQWRGDRPYFSYLGEDGPSATQGPYLALGR